ncbi:glutamyl-Q tRNA(Asp) synthetase [Amorphus suaedae]
MADESPPTVRFAPSPNGYLHLGHALSAILNAETAEARAGRFLIRIDDLDTNRARPEFEAAIFEDLRWLGLAFDPDVRRQSDHVESYEDALARLDAIGLIRRSVATRREIADAAAAADAAGTPWRRDPDGGWHVPPDEVFLPEAVIGERIEAGRPATLRLRMNDALARVDAPLTFRELDAGPRGETGEVRADPAAWGDVVVGRSDVPGSYHLSVVVDDAAQGISHVIRGQDLFHATSIHRLLQALLGLPAPVYRHHRLILDTDGRKLSKSSGSTSLRELRAGGLSAAEVRRRIGLEAGPGG